MFVVGVLSCRSILDIFTGFLVVRVVSWGVIGGDRLGGGILDSRNLSRAFGGGNGLNSGLFSYDLRSGCVLDEYFFNWRVFSSGVFLGGVVRK